MANTVHFFLGANSGQGFQNLFTNFCTPANHYDLVVLKGGSNTTEVYGRVFGETSSHEVTVDNGKKPEDPDYETSTETVYEDSWGIEYGNGQRTPTTRIKYGVQAGDYVSATLKRDRQGKMAITNIKKLTELANVSNSAWTGTSSVLVGGRSYSVPKSVLCFNLDNETWIDLETAQKYSEIANLYASPDGMIRIVEVRHRG